MVCPNCYSSDFRLSHFRARDFQRLFILQYPVRCLGCEERFYTYLPHAFSLLQARRQARDAKANNHS
jgi:transcriptional regulator NrdR family protein